LFLEEVLFSSVVVVAASLLSLLFSSDFEDEESVSVVVVPCGEPLAENGGGLDAARMMVPPGMVSQEDDFSQQAEGSGPQQNLTSLLSLLKLAGQGTSAMSRGCSFGSGRMG
jgi:hypothetical protein